MFRLLCSPLKLLRTSTILQRMCKVRRKQQRTRHNAIDTWQRNERSKHATNTTPTALPYNHTHKRTDAHTYAHTYAHTGTCTHNTHSATIQPHAHTHAQMRTHTHTRLHICTHTRTHTHTYAHAHPRTHSTHTRTHTTHTHGTL